MYEAEKVGSFSSKIEAAAAGRVLESEGIPYLIRTTRPAIPEDAPWESAIYVAPDIAERARVVLAAYAKGESVIEWTAST
jgi:hypothetical protein